MVQTVENEIKKLLNNPQVTEVSKGIKGYSELNKL